MNAVRLALGTLTVVPVRAPTHVDARTAGRAMALAPLVGLLLGLAAWAVLAGAGGGPLAAALAVALLALATRGLHLDGLADTADGLGSGRPAPDALALMRRGDVGPFGVVALVLALLLQVAALAGTDGPLVVLAVTVSRLVLPLLCTRRWPAARADGLGASVAGTVPAGWALAAVAPVLVVAVAVGAATDPWRAAAVVVVPLLVAGGLALRCVRRLGGTTGDVLGACVEVAFTTALVAGLVSPFG